MKLPMMQNFPELAEEACNNIEQLKNKNLGVNQVFLKNVNFHIPRDGNRRFIVTERILELKSIIKTDIDGNPSDEISYFKDMCRSHKLFEQKVRYQVSFHQATWGHKMLLYIS